MNPRDEFDEYKLDAYPPGAVNILPGNKVPSGEIWRIHDASIGDWLACPCVGSGRATIRAMKVPCRA